MPGGGHGVGTLLDLGQLVFELVEAVAGGGVLLALEGLALDLELEQAAVELVERLGLAVDLHA